MDVKISALPAASTLTGTEKLAAAQGATSVSITPPQLATFLGGTFQPLDGDLTALAALTGTNTLYYRSAANTWSPVTIGSNLTFSGGTLAVTAGGSGTVTSVSVTTANGVSGTVATATTTPAITLTLGAITPSSVAATGTVTGSNLSGTNTGDQTSVTGNAGTATKWQTARTLSFTGDATGSGSVDGSANVATTLTLGTSGVTAGTYGGTGGVASITLDAKGRATSASTVTLGVAGGGTGTTTSTGTGSVVLSASPTLTGTPTAPTASAGTATTQIATTALVDAQRDYGFLSLSGSRTLALTDRGEFIDWIGAGTITIPANASVSFPLGTRITISNLSGAAQTIAAASGVTLFWLGGSSGGGTGIRSLSSSGWATLIKRDTDAWVVFGAGVS